MENLLPFPLLALVGQDELKTALVLGLINPQIGGVLLSGPYGVGKTTAVRGLLDIMPQVDYEVEDREGHPQTIRMPMRLVELPLNARIEDVVGGLNERVALEQRKAVLEEGVLAKAHKSLLYIDEINLLDPQVVDVILDAAAQGRVMVRRGPLIRLFPSQFVLVGSMNPEEGRLRPQILDRFGLRVWVSPLPDSHERIETYRRSQAFRSDPVAFRARYADQTEALREEVAVAREILPHVTIPADIETLVATLTYDLRIPSHRAEIALLEAARARAAADFRGAVIAEDIQQLAPLALRQRHSTTLDAYAAEVRREDQTIGAALERAGLPNLPPEQAGSDRQPPPASTAHEHEEPLPLPREST
jgi:magnesium chelatase subunit I